MVTFGGSLDALEAIAGEQRLTTRGKLFGWTSQRRLFFKVIECVSIYLFCNFIVFFFFPWNNFFLFMGFQFLFGVNFDRLVLAGA